MPGSHDHTDSTPDPLFTLDQLTQDRLQAFAEKFKKNGFKMTSTLAKELRRVAVFYFIYRIKDQKVLRPSEERKHYEELHYLFVELKKKFMGWDGPLCRQQFLRRVTEPYWKFYNSLDDDGRRHWQQTHPPVEKEVFLIIEVTEILVLMMERFLSEVLQKLPKDLTVGHIFYFRGT